MSALPTRIEKESGRVTSPTLYAGVLYRETI